MLLQRFTKVISLLKDARSLCARLLLRKDPRTAHQVILLQKLLDRIQSSIISIRADFIEMVFPDRPARANDTWPETLRVLRPLSGAGRSGAPPFDRRHRHPDRRRLHTYLAHDRRSGIADRRRMKPSRNALR
jgi:hypothetical protein